MASWRCLGCRTVYPPGVPACPPCEAKEAAMAHANAHGSTHYVGEGDPLPSDLNEEVRLVGPGAPPQAAAEGPVTRDEVSALIDEKLAAVTGSDLDVVPDPSPDGDSTPPASLPVSSDPGNYAGQTILELRAICRDRGLPVAGAKADLVMRLNDDDKAAVA